MTTTYIAVHTLTHVNTSCGHIVFMTETMANNLKRSHETFWCTVCGNSQHWSGKSDLEQLRGRLATTQDMLETARQERQRVEYQRRAEKAAKTRIKNRIAKGVCPCCNRTFQDLQRHMTTKHPNYATTE